MVIDAVASGAAVVTWQRFEGLKVAPDGVRGIAEDKEVPRDLAFRMLCSLEGDGG